MGVGPNESGSSRYHIYREIEGSLRRLKTDYIDVYYFHIPDPTTPLEESIRAMDDLVQQGKVRYIGTSHFAAWQIAHGLRLAERNRLTPWVVEQPRYCLIDRAIEQEVVPMAQDLGYRHRGAQSARRRIPHRQVQTGSAAPAGFPLCRAAGRHYLAAAALRPDDDRAQSRRGRDRATLLRGEYDTTPSAIALAWVLAKPFVSSAIIGPKNPMQLEDNLAAADVTLAPEEVAQLDAVSEFARSLIRW